MHLTFRFAPVAALLITASSAQVTLSGNLSDGTTGPLLTGTVYHVTGAVTVPLGATLTIQPGVVVKFNFDQRMHVLGTLLCNGTGLDSVWFTDVRDDTVGGDSNGDGNATTPAGGWWRGITFGTSSSASVVNGLTARYGGRFDAAFELQSADLTLTNCRARDFVNDGFDLQGTSFPTLATCSAQNCTGEAFNNVHIGAVPGFTGLSASANGANRIRVTNGTVANGAVITIGPQNGVNGAIHMATTLLVQALGSLTLQAGAVVKFQFDARADILGDLFVNGLFVQPVWFTDERDDAHGGDSNGDGGASTPAAGWWRGIQFNVGSSASVVQHARVRYGGRFISGLEFSSADPSISNSIVQDFTGDGIDLNSNSRPTLANIQVLQCTGTAFAGVPIHALPGFSGLSASGNGLNWINVTTANVSATDVLTIGPQNGILGTVRFGATTTIAAGGRVTMQAGLICKMAFDTRFDILGQLHVQGTAGMRVYFTDERDDAVGGDSNTDGTASVPSNGWWRGLNFTTTADGSALAFATIRYGGRFISAIEINNAAISMDRCIISDFNSVGLDFNNSTEPCTFIQLRVDRCVGNAIDNVRIDRVVDFIRARGTGNQANRLVVRSGSMTGTVTIDPINQFEGSIYIAQSLTVQSGATLNLQPGVVLKMAFDTRIDVLGAFSVRGSLADPVVITDERDDSVGGDSNGDGALTVPGPGWWRGISFVSAANPSTVLGLDVRYGGRFIANIVVSQPTAFLREVRSSFSSGDGFEFAAHAIPASRLVAFGNLSDGIQLNGGSFDLRQATCVGNGSFGVRSLAAWTGNVVDSIVWNNTGGTYTGIGAGRVRYSDGDAGLAGTAGNIFGDPLFVNQALGDLHLTAASPCINTGDPSSPIDPDSTRADMGAYFFNFCEPEVFCAQTPHPPCIPSLEYQGFASLSSPAPFWLRLHDSPTLSFAIFFYGIGARTTVAGAFGNICVGGPYQRLAPVPSGGNLADGPCVGLFELDFNTYLRTGADPAIIAGSNVIGHFWYRYGLAPGNAAFSQAIEMPVCP